MSCVWATVSCRNVRKTGQYVPHLSVQDTFNRKESIGLVWRLEALIAPYLVAKEMKSALSFFSDLKVPVEYLVVDYDSPSKGLYAYAEWIDLLHSEQIQLPVSVTGLVSWLQDNPEGFEVLLGAAEAVSVQLYQGSERVDLSDDLVLAIESYNNVHISLYCPDTGLLDYLWGKCRSAGRSTLVSLTALVAVICLNNDAAAGGGGYANCNTVNFGP